ncbi:hypothetical protein CEXT_767231 [Caerostris extrusa]|uniref:Uncharacterized protein n=1 Tax=Caerostris extrusa TaxID=172846 RepID=A0AAV4P4B9_CAEEX|nr:hypothetical protein CEXT_767231 [Caerostris extrusa]
MFGEHIPQNPRYPLDYPSSIPQKNSEPIGQAKEEHARNYLQLRPHPDALVPAPAKKRQKGVEAEDVYCVSSSSDQAACAVPERNRLVQRSLQRVDGFGCNLHQANGLRSLAFSTLLEEEAIIMSTSK